MKTLIQFSDSHLFADPTKQHAGSPVYQNLAKTLADISQQNADAILFTGDLTQDHTLESYYRFVELVERAKLPLSVHWLAGNHDDHEIMAEVLAGDCFNSDKQIMFGNWLVKLIDSKSETPAGFIEHQVLEHISCSEKQHELLVSHHHPVDIGYFIDRHGMKNQTALKQAIAANANIKGYLTGHVHRAEQLTITLSNREIPVFTCPATSVQFAKDKNNMVAQCTLPRYHIVSLHDDGNISREVKIVT